MAKFTNEEKMESVKQYLPGSKAYKTIAKERGITHRNLLYWIRKYQYHGDKAFIKSYTNYPLQYKLDVLNYMNEDWDVYH